MSMTTRIAYANAKYHKSKNILTGIAIFLTTLLLFLVPTMGTNMIEGQFAAINEIYPTWHALFRNVNENSVIKLAAHHTVDNFGLRSDVGIVSASDANIALLYLDENGFDLYNLELLLGSLPQHENEIVVSERLLKKLGQPGDIGDTIHVPYQIYRNGGLDYKEEKDFVITGLFEEGVENDEKNVYSVFVSKAFLTEQIPIDEILYRFLFQVQNDKSGTTDEIEESIQRLAIQFHIDENNVVINNDYLFANYVDPSTVPIMIGIMLIIVFAGVITIYSIYYVSMSDRIREFGKIKAIGATNQQLRQIVLREGLFVACIAIPIGLFAGTVLSKAIFSCLFRLYKDENIMVTTMKSLLQENRIQLYHWWIYIIAIIVTLLTVYVSLRKPMRVAARVSEIEAIGYQDGKYSVSKKKIRKGYTNISVCKLATIHQTNHKKKSLITICSMGITGVFLMVVSTILACANPIEITNSSILGQYELSPVVESGNKEHPEREWKNVQKNNPLSMELKEKIEQIHGIKKVDCFIKTYVSSEIFQGYKEGLVGIPMSYKEELERGIIEGEISYDDLIDGTKVVIHENLLRWYPEIELGDTIEVTAENGVDSFTRQLEVIAIGDYPRSLTNYNYLIMAEAGVQTFSDNNLNYYYHIFGEKEYDESIENQIKELIGNSELIEIRTWQEILEEEKSVMSLTSGACYAFLGVLGVICIMNMVNTMIHSVHIRKKEIGMLQAIGMSDSQLLNMLLFEGLFYTIGTLALSVGIGSMLGYPVFLWAKENGILGIRYYHYPTMAAIIISIILVVVLFILTIILGRSVKKESLIDRIRFSE